MTCQDVRELLSVWRDGEAAGSAGLSGEERLAVQRHLDECATCRDALARLDRTVSGVRELAKPTSAPPLVTMRALALGRKYADEMSTEAHERPPIMVPAARSGVRHAAVMPAAPAAPAPAPSAPRQQLSSKRPSRLTLGLLVGLGLAALLLLAAFALGFRF